MTVYEVMNHVLHGSNGTSLNGFVHTSLQRRDEHSIALQFHTTDILTAYEDGRIVLDDGGKHVDNVFNNGKVKTLTATTKKRINLYLPENWYLYQSKLAWWLVSPDGVTHAYKRYMTLHTDNTVTYHEAAPGAAREVVERV